MDKIYSESPEMREIAQKLINKYYLYLGHIQADNIYFAEIEGTKPKKGEIMTVSGVSSPWVKQLMLKNDSTLYCVAVYGEEWDDLSPTMQRWMVFDALMRIDPENDGKLRKPDICDFGILLDYFGQIGIGPYWRTSSNLPDLLEGDPLPIPLPPDNQDDGSTL